MNAKYPRSDDNTRPEALKKQMGGESARSWRTDRGRSSLKPDARHSPDAEKRVLATINIRARAGASSTKPDEMPGGAPRELRHAAAARPEEGVCDI